ncbi:hypothetical protein CANINC_003470 [Pichia inconspicua]|uniref:DNA damage checkpoint control protein RAD17 n=1 Tax=Pichia inconspicua TaxID=52247 RepID=A0A4T0WYQ3_9ASCO|nr:hypothetical protein CANINC_003470 [[Candida] inconspicua]
MEKLKNTVSTLEDADRLSSDKAAWNDNQRQTNKKVIDQEKHGRAAINDKLLFPQFTATTTSIQLLHKLISSVDQFGDYCVLEISSEGMSFGITDGNVCRVKLNLNKKLFNSYKFNGVWKGSGVKFSDEQIFGDETDLSDEETNDYWETNGFDVDGVISICINLASFIESINILMKDSKLGDNIVECTLRYERDGDPLILIFEDELIVERCELSTYFSEEIKSLRVGKSKTKKDQRVTNTKETTPTVNDLVKDFELDAVDNVDSIFRLDSEKVLFDIILKSDILHDIIKDMNDLMTERFVLYCKHPADRSPDSRDNKTPKLIFISKSSSDSIGFSKLIIPHRKVNIPDFNVYKPLSTNANRMEEPILIDCHDLSLSSTYHHQYFAKLLKALRLSKLIKMRKDMNGITSLLLLLGKSSFGGKQNGVDKLHGSSIEFITLESISISEFFTLSVQPTQETLMSKLGYDNEFVEQIIKNDQEIQTIRVGNDGQLITLDEYFVTPANEFEAIEHPNKNNSNNVGNINDHISDHVSRMENVENHMEEFIPVENLTTELKKTQNSIRPTKLNEKRNKNILKITEQLARSLLGHTNSSDRVIDGDIDVQVEKSFVEHSDDEKHLTDRKRRRIQSNSLKLRNKKKETRKYNKSGKHNKDDNNGIETVGGAIEIPLFI